MTRILADETDRVLDASAADLDIPDKLYEDAVAAYTEVGEWLAAEDSELAAYGVEVYPQGSFRLGTMVRPLRGGGEYDIDLVCCLAIERSHLTQAELRAKIGRRLRANPAFAEVLEGSRRCWVLSFSDRFHLDVLPCVPNAELPPTGIWLTDKELRFWQRSNPKGYASWFLERMPTLTEMVQKASVEGVPEWRVRTPLQRACQLLKRHRDIRFASDTSGLQPISIIISTLAAKAYAGEASASAALLGILGRMETHIERVDGQWRIVNPTDPAENFADKWCEKPERAETFLRWLQDAKQDFGAIVGAGTMVERAEAVQKALRPSERVLDGMRKGEVLSSAAIYEAATPPVLADERHERVPPWPMALECKVRVAGGVYGRRGSRKKLWDLTGRPVNKEKAILFKAETNVPLPYEVFWQVLNTGAEARASGQLRGGFDPSDSGTSARWETTAYAGTHWVRAFVVRRGVCVARSEKVYVQIRP